MELPRHKKPFLISKCVVVEERPAKDSSVSMPFQPSPPLWETGAEVPHWLGWGHWHHQFLLISEDLSCNLPETHISCTCVWQEPSQALASHQSSLSASLSPSRCVEPSSALGEGRGCGGNGCYYNELIIVYHVINSNNVFVINHLLFQGLVRGFFIYLNMRITVWANLRETKKWYDTILQ